ncbi:hypothetical protein [Bradyrhizobium sp.]|uniref:hypothetical protein n=1 Tax=Bradyrhizobium sp. TaxID=376 RepID=UPI0039E6E204
MSNITILSGHGKSKRLRLIVSECEKSGKRVCVIESPISHIAAMAKIRAELPAVVVMDDAGTIAVNILRHIAVTLPSVQFFIAQ